MGTSMNEHRTGCGLKHACTKQEKERHRDTDKEGEREKRGTVAETQREGKLVVLVQGLYHALKLAVSAYVSTLASVEQLACPYAADRNVS